MSVANHFRPLDTLPILTSEEIEDAEFQAKDLAWSELIRVYEYRKLTDSATLEKVGKIIGKSKQEVHRWLSSPMAMTLRAFGMLAEGLDSDIVLRLEPRNTPDAGCNYYHPCDEAAAQLRWRTTPVQRGCVPLKLGVAHLTSAKSWVVEA